jgi:isoleucyl-tRNA synthetase
MSEYKDSLNLPKTDFPMKANLSKREPDILKKWEDLNLYKKLREKGKSRKKFIFHDGPPYANAHIHMGTAVNKILKDIVVKSKTFSGYESAFIPGWDCHGLPIELNVEKKVGKAGHKISKTEFRKACRDYAISQVNIQREEFKRLGIIADWEHPYLTMDFNFEADVVRSLAKIIEKDHVQKGVKPVYWCLDCGSALAEAEVEYFDKTSDAIDVRFKVHDEKSFPIKAGTGTISIPIWTTTPWTLPANMAVALNPLVDYALVQCGDERLLIAAPLVEAVMQRYEGKNFQTLDVMRGEVFENISLQHPFFTRTVPVILADFVTVEAGTGAVHIAGAHGIDDFAASKKNNLTIINIIQDDGTFQKDLPLIGGMHVTKVNDTIIQELKNKNNLLHATKLTHSYPCCWRHKTPVIYRATPQWFVSMDKNGLRAAALASIDRAEWIPDWGRNRIYSMIENRPDWCISRQRTWGVPIAVFLHKETGEMHPQTVALMEEVAKKIAKEGIEGWFSCDIAEFLGNDASLYKKCEDVLDVWFDSGVTHECVLRKRPELGFPADLYLEGSDQHRGWFHSSLLTSVAMNGVAPYKAVLTHGYVIDIEGRKMSKSIGNVIAPETIMQSMGADILRLWAASIDYRGDIFISDEILNRAADTYRRIRNTARFLLANLHGFTPEKDMVSADNMLALDAFIVDKAHRLQQEIIEAYDQYQFHQIYQKIHQFCSIDLGSFYLDIIKDRQYTTKENSLARRSTQTAMFHIVEALVRWLAPILSFTAEEIWHFIPGTRNESVFLNAWYEDLTALSQDNVMNAAFWEKIREIRNDVNKHIEEKRNEGVIGSSLEAEVLIECQLEKKKLLDLLGDELRFVFISSKVIVKESSEEKISISSLKKFAKCERCWHRCEDVGRNPGFPTLCLRCVTNIEDGAGEVRKYA